MPSVMGLLEERERAARQRVEALQAELRDAEAVWERFVIARETESEVLAEPRGGGDASPVAVVGGESGAGHFGCARFGGAALAGRARPDGSRAGLPADHGCPVRRGRNR